MDILVFSLSCISPFFLYLTVGYLAKRLLHIRAESFLDLNKLAFYTLLSSNLFLNIYGKNVEGVNFGSTLFFAVLAVVAVLSVFWPMYRIRKIANTDRSVLIQGIMRTNFILFGIPLTERIIGHPTSGLAGILTAVIIPTFNVLAVFILTIYSDRQPGFRSVVRSLVSNPLLIAAFSAILLNVFHADIGSFAQDILKSLSSAAIPIALIALGGRFTFTKYGSSFLVIEFLFYRLILIPAVVTSVAIFLGFHGEELALILVLFASPPSVTSYTMAQQMGANEHLAAKILVYGTILSSISLFGFISVFKYLGYF